MTDRVEHPGDGYEEEGAGSESPSPTPLFYTNSLGLIAGLYDFTFLFGHRVGQEVTERRFAVVMSPQHAAALLLALQTHLKVYEKKFGAIVLPEKLRARLIREPEVEERHD